MPTEEEQRCSPTEDLLKFVGNKRFATVLADPPWQFVNRTGKIAPEHRRLSRYETMDLKTIKALPVSKIALPTAHLYLWVPNALLPQGLEDDGEVLHPGPVGGRLGAARGPGIRAGRGRDGRRGGGACRGTQREEGGQGRESHVGSNVAKAARRESASQSPFPGGFVDASG